MIEQLKDAIRSGRNIFITGAGGTGKTYVLSKILEENPTEFSITASTGVASKNISDKAVTFSKFTGIGVTNCEHGLDDKSFEFLTMTIPDTSRSCISYCQRLVIEELSMISAGQLDVVDRLFRHIRGRPKEVFGGVQVIVLGDFCQLEPVITSEILPEKILAFESDTWKKLNLYNVYLTEIKRTNDLFFAEMLHRLRLGKHSEQDLDVYRATWQHKLINPLKLYATNYEVDRENKRALDNNKNPLMEVKGSYEARNFDYIKDILKDLKTPYNLQLKIGCRVMITVNERRFPNEREGEPLDYVNGTMGTFYGFGERETKRARNHTAICEITGRKYITHGTIKYQVALIKLDNEEGYLELKKYKWEHPYYENVWFSQYPLMLAHGLSVHKCQGLSLDEVEIDCKNIKQPNQFYVAVSRARSLEGLRIVNFNPSCIKTSKKAIEFYEELEKEMKNRHETEPCSAQV